MQVNNKGIVSTVWKVAKTEERMHGCTCQGSLGDMHVILEYQVTAQEVGVKMATMWKRSRMNYNPET
jgi:hypothetical protein